MVKRFLITTADERSWQTENPILFLGEWCRLYHRRKTWESLDAEIVPYHWDDRQKLHQDYIYLSSLYEDLLKEVSVALNQFHNVDHSLRYWRIFVGPWLGYFTQMVFDRWVTVHRAAKMCSIEETLILDIPAECIIPNDMGDFIRLFVGDAWNHYLYSKILKNWTSIPYSHIPYSDNLYADSSASHASSPRPFFKNHLKQFLKSSLHKLSKTASSSNDAFLISTYLPIKQSISLQLALKQFPAFWTSPQLIKAIPCQEFRKNFSLNIVKFTGFEQCLRVLIQEQIPTLYLEGYQQLQSIVESLSWPKFPKVIWTSNSYSSDDVFKAWAAQKVETSSSLVIGQHGGHYGSGLWSFSEEHEVRISDRYFTWGWTENSSKHLPVGVVKLLGKGKGFWSPSGGLLLVTSTMPRYSYWMYSAPVAKQYLSYLNDQFAFADYLPLKIRQQLLVRLYSQDYGWGQSQRWNDRHPDIRLNLGKDPIQPLIKKSRLYIATYNATTFLETLGQNIPTIMFWNPHYWELRPSAQPYFEELKRVGIFHETPESGAAKVATVWDDVEAWWYSREVQEVRQIFCDRFTKIPENPTQVLKKALTDLVEFKKSLR